MKMKTLRLGLMTASAMALLGTPAFADYELNILHINDLHSRIEEINKYDSTCTAEEAEKKECFGGIARVKTAIDTGRASLKDSNVLVLDAGDQFQGSLFYSTYKSGPIADFMNDIGFDAMAIGNHEFDDGPEELLKFIDALEFPIISGNTVAADNSPLASKFKGYIVKDIGGQKVAVVSVLATDTDETSAPGDSIHFEDEIEYLRRAVTEIEEQGVNKIVLLSHVGYERDKEIAAAVDGIDVIVGGHSHTLLSSTDDNAAGPYPTLVKNPGGSDVPIVQAYAYSKYLGNLQIVFDDNGVIKSSKGAPQLLDASIVPDAGLVAKVKELGAPLEELKSKIVGSSEDIIVGDRTVCRAKECSMGNLVADAQLERVKDQGVTISIANSGGLRASIDAGDITMGEVLTVLPFQNTVATFQLKGSDLLVALENGVGQIEEGAGRFPQVSGMKYAFDASRPAGNRVSNVQVWEVDAYVPLNPEKTYGVVTNNYVRGGGDGYAIFADKAINPYDFGPNLEQVVADYITANNPYKPYTDGRITDMTHATKAAEADSMTETAKPAAPASAESETPVITGETTTAKETASSTPSTHTVIAGESLWKIAASTYGDGRLWTKIAEANNLRDANRLEIGEELVLPAR